MHNINYILDRNMCTGCAGCYVVCPTKCISFESGAYVNYPIINEKACIKCKKCLNVCPGMKIEKRLIDDKKIEFESGISEVKVSWTNDNEIRRNSSSGGIITQTIKYLFENNNIDSAIVVTQKNGYPLENDVQVITTVTELLKSQGSRYSPAGNCKALVDILKNDKYKDVAFIGKPCEIESMNSMINMDKRIKEKIKFKISIMCHHTPTRKGLIELLESKGIQYDKVQSLKFRGNGWPGKFQVNLECGEIYQTTYFDAWKNYLSQDENVACMYCDNPIPTGVDLVVGDPWGQEYDEEKIGKSLTLITSECGRKIINEMEEMNVIKSEVKSINDFKRFQKNLLKRYSEFYLTALLYKSVHREKVKVKDVIKVYKENPKNILRYFKRIKNYKELYKEWRYE